MRPLVFATGNRHKISEVHAMLGEQFQLQSLKDIGCQEDIPETSPTIEGNALQKARYVWQGYGLDCFSEDTGLEVHALDNEPGVYSARYAGPQRNAADNMALLLEKLQHKTDRSARFKTVIALILDGKEYTFEGIVRGHILKAKQGTEGFGYDPIFCPEGEDRSFAQMNGAEKNAISHRGQAIRQLVDFLRARSQEH